MDRSKQAGLNYTHIQRATIEVFEEFAKAGEKPASEHWTLYDHPKAKTMIRRVRAVYKTRTGVSCDCRAHVIAQAWMDYRKAGKPAREQMRRDCEIDGVLDFIA